MANKDKKNATSFQIGNKAREIYTLETTTELFEKLLSNAETNNDVLCLHDALKALNIRHSGFDYLLKKFPELENYKRDIQSVIVSRINKKGLNSEFNPTMSIWRMKMLGEQEISKQEVKQSTELEIKGDPFELMRKNAGLDK